MAKGKSKSKDDSHGDKGKSIVTEEELRRQQEISRIGLRQKQMREQRYVHINNIKINNQWRKIKRMTKVEDLKRNVEILAQNHEREVDRKDAIVQILDRDLDDCDDQYLLASRRHVAILDELCNLQSSAICKMNEAFEEECRNRIATFEREKDDVNSTYDRRAGEVASLISVMETEFAEAESDDRQEFEAQREEIKNKNSEEYNVLKIQLEGTVEGLEQQFDSAHKAYMSETEHRSRAFQQLSKKDGAAAEIIETRTKKLRRLQEGLTHWRRKISTTLNSWEQRNESLKHEKEMMSKYHRSLKSSMESFRDIQSQRLKHLSISSRNAEDVIRNKLETAEAILKLWRMGQGFETEKEQILPFSATLDDACLIIHSDQPHTIPEKTSEDHENSEEKTVKYDDDVFRTTAYNEAKASYTSTAMNSEGTTEVEKHNYFQNFFRKYNAVLMSTTAVEQEQKRLEVENQKLRAILKRYLNGLSVNAEVLDDPANSLLIINNKLQTKLKTKEQRKTQQL